MARTVNRQPLQVSTSSGTYGKDEFFNQVNWKGMNVDKNFLVADGESFESCNNVYVNTQGILRSRPALKIDLNRNISNVNIIDCVSISGETFYILEGKADEDGVKHCAVKHRDYVTPYDFTAPVKLFLIEDNVYIFSNGVAKYFNLTKSGSYDDALEHIYSPRKVVNLFSYAESKEAANILNKRYLTTYQYQDGVQEYLVNGKTLKVKIDGMSHQFTFNSLSKFLFYDNYLPSPFELTGNNLNDNFDIKVFGRDGYDSVALLDTTNKKIYYSVNGSHWDLELDVSKDSDDYRLYDIEEINFTDDGNELYLYSHSEPYLLSVVQTADANGNLYYRYEKPTSVRKLYGIPGGFDLSYGHYASHDNILFQTGYTGTEGDSVNVGYRFVRNGVYSYMSRSFSHVPTKSCCFYNYGADEYAYFYFWYGSWLWEKPDGTTKLYELPKDNISSYGFPVIKRVDSSKIVCLLEGQMFQSSKRALRTLTIDNYTPILGQLSPEYDPYVSPELKDEDGNYYPFYDDPFLSTDGKSFGRALDLYESGSAASQTAPWVKAGLGLGNYYHFLNKDRKICNTKLLGVIELFEVATLRDDDLLAFEMLLRENNTASTSLSDLYISAGNNLYITEPRYDETGNFLLNIPDYNLQTFTSEITALHPISKSEVAVFLNNEIWVCTKDESVYKYNKTKIPLGVPYGTDILGSYEADATIFMTKRGLAFLKYQDYVASTEQNLSFVSDPIYAAIENKASRLKNATLYKHWIVLYGVNPSTNFTEAYVYDLRNGSWWPMESKLSLTKLLEIDNKLYAFNGNFYEFSVSDSNYYDDVSIQSQSPIDWHLTSQKLHFGAISYSKHIANITLFSVLDSDKPMSFDLTIKCYRKLTNTTEIQTNEFFVDAIRTYVQRLSFPKVNEFQYTISSDAQQAIRVPLSLSGLTIKYRIGSQVR